jgi:hypothetical protein
MWKDKYALLSAKKIMNKRYITDGNDVYGYITGLSLWNGSGMSTQVPNHDEVATNIETEEMRDVLIGGYKRVRLRKSRATITKENVYTLQFLDLIDIVQPVAQFNDLERYMLKRFVGKIKELGVTRDSISRYINLFPPSVNDNGFKESLESWDWKDIEDPNEDHCILRACIEFNKVEALHNKKCLKLSSHSKRTYPKIY